MRTDNLTQIQRDTLHRLLVAWPAPIRCGYGPSDMSGTTGGSLAGRGLAVEVDRPAGAKRGTYYTLSDYGRTFARQLAAKEGRPVKAAPPEGVLHRHADGREHRHFSAGFTIGSQVRPDADGTEDHQHSTIRLDGAPSTTPKSGPVVWHERQTPASYRWAASVGLGRWYGFETREAAEAWMEANHGERAGQVVPAALANNELEAPPAAKPSPDPEPIRAVGEPTHGLDCQDAWAAGGSCKHGR